MLRLRSFRLAFIASLSACALSFARTATAADDTSASVPVADQTTASTTANTTASTTGSSVGSTAPSTSGSATGDEPSLEHPFEVAPGAFRCSPDFAAGGHPEYKDRNCYSGRLEAPGVFLYGGLELDTGFAQYGYRDDKQYPYENLYDLRGRFVVGPMLHHEFGNSGFFVRATGQLVAWVRDQNKIYQLNVDDVYGQAGGPIGGGHWDVQIGRFMTWRVFHKGLGFDLYTLEDNGAAITHDVGTNVVRYGNHTYEVNYIYLRNYPDQPIADETAGRAAIHYFPTKSFAAELTGVYGQANTGLDNSIGGRLALDYHDRLGPVLVRLSAAAEDRFDQPTKHGKPYTLDPVTNQPIYHECSDCNVKDFHGVGGDAVLKWNIVEAGGGLARGWQFIHDNGTEGAPRNKASTLDRISYGGYLQLDPGRLLFKRSLIVGGGLFEAHMETRTQYSETHLQGAAYIAFPLGFNDAMLKLVLSRAKLDTYEKTSAAAVPDFTHHEYSMTAARLRFAYYF